MKLTSNAKYVLILILALIYGLLIYIDYVRTPPTITKFHGASNLKVNESRWKKAPDIKFTDVNGKNFSLSDFEGKVVLLNFWTSWCYPCVKEFPSLMELINQFEGNVVLIAVSNDDHINDVTGFTNRFIDDFADEMNGPDVHIVWDPKKLISAQTFHSNRYPETIIFAKSGEMARKVAGEIDWIEPNMVRYLDELLNYEKTADF